MAAAAVSGLVTVLESYRGRDRVIRTLCYSCQLLGGVMSNKSKTEHNWGKSLLIVSSQLSHCRTVLRLFDDLAMLAYSVKYGFGKKEKDSLIRWISIFSNISDQLYYPCEHIAWAADSGVIHAKSEMWWMASTALWGISLILGIVKSLRNLMMLRRYKGKNSKEEPPKSRGEIKSQIRSEVLCIISCLSDLFNAIHWMPSGFLWGGSSPTWLVGLMGTISSLIGIYQTTEVGSAGGV
ncbi:peroxisomal biogenesis factor 11 gamma S homeolog [Xenopus laevis]|uniref:MGC114945 protein n=1 Tax=Xenopus laevis TaxID=8355 RepID=Q566H5_XENLA|nr:peroxisomal biogenesis factor 11 gamma S homeolog [Xenopus laevis]AAH93545.1 MGC114945 protein [Xenopus laevis]